MLASLQQISYKIGNNKREQITIKTKQLLFKLNIL